MLLDPVIGSNENLHFRSTYSLDEDHKFDEFCSGLWWKEAEIRSGVHPTYEYELMPISMYADGANPDFRRKTSLCPIVVQCLNFSGQVLRSNNGKKIVGYFPKLKVTKIS